MRTAGREGRPGSGAGRAVRGLWMAIVLLGLTAPPEPVAQSEKVDLELGDQEREEFRLAVGKSRILRSPRPVEQLILGNEEVADVKLLTSRQVLILGRSAGLTNLALRSEQGDLIALLDVLVGHDLTAIKRKLHEVLPEEEDLQVRASSGSVLLSGEVSSKEAMDTALAITRSFAGDEVTNRLQVGGGQQVMLEVNVSEVNRDALRSLGVDTTNNLGDTPQGGNNLGSPAPGMAGTPEAGASGTSGDDFAFDFLQESNLQASPFGTLGMLFEGVNFQIKALEEKGLASTLAEPNIIALSGQEASFLVGGEFPVPAAQSSAGTEGMNAITVDFKEFGVGLEFTPVVLSPGKININLQTEVSNIDPTASFRTPGGFNIPGLATRRASSTVELGDGESFALAGLIKNEDQSTVSKFPILGEIPILGALFRSTDFQQNRSELVIVVTPHLVKPGREEQMAMPTDGVLPPSRFDQYLMGRVEGLAPEEPADGRREAEGASAGTPPEDGGMEGAYGHQL